MALIIGIVAIMALIAYWFIMITLIAIGFVLAFWAVIFATIFGDPYVGGVCSVFATGLTFWLYNKYDDKKKPIT